MSDRSLCGRRILIVEDEMMILLMIQDMLADLGCTSVASAATVAEALALIAAQPFDAAMLDVNLNGNRSHAVADALATRGVPFVVSTGYTDHPMWDGHGDRPVLHKPFHHADLVAMFAHLLPS